MNEIERRLRSFWEPPSPSAAGNPPKMAFPDGGKVTQPVPWTQTVLPQGMQGKFGKQYVKVGMGLLKRID
jgi:hypothetical protein